VLFKPAIIIYEMWSLALREEHVGLLEAYLKTKCLGQYVDLTGMKHEACDITEFGTYRAPTSEIQKAKINWACSSDEEHEEGIRHCS
jgi:hypothetical protein